MSGEHWVDDVQICDLRWRDSLQLGGMWASLLIFLSPFCVLILLISLVPLLNSYPPKGSHRHYNWLMCHDDRHYAEQSKSPSNPSWFFEWCPMSCGGVMRWRDPETSQRHESFSPRCRGGVMRWRDPETSQRQESFSPRCCNRCCCLYEVLEILLRACIHRRVLWRLVLV